MGKKKKRELRKASERIGPEPREKGVKERGDEETG